MTKDNKNKKVRIGAFTVKDKQQLNSRGYMVTALINLFFVFVLFINQPDVMDTVVGYNSIKAGISIFLIGDAFSNLFNLKFASSRKLFSLLLLNAVIAFVTIALVTISHFSVMNALYWMYFAAAMLSIIARASLLNYISKKVLVSNMKDFKTDGITMIVFLVAALCGVGLYFASANYLALIIVYIFAIAGIMASIAFIMWKNNAAFYLEPSWYLVFAINLAVAMTLVHTIGIRFDVVMLAYSWIVGLSVSYAELYVINYRPNWQETEPIFGVMNPNKFKEEILEDDIDERASEIFTELRYWDEPSEDEEEIDELENKDNEDEIFH